MIIGWPKYSKMFSSFRAQVEWNFHNIPNCNFLKSFSAELQRHFFLIQWLDREDFQAWIQTGAPQNKNSPMKESHPKFQQSPQALPPKKCSKAPQSFSVWLWFEGVSIVECVMAPQIKNIFHFPVFNRFINSHHCLRINLYAHILWYVAKCDDMHSIIIMFVLHPIWQNNAITHLIFFFSAPTIQ